MNVNFVRIHEALVCRGFELIKSYPLPKYFGSLTVDGVGYSSVISFSDVGFTKLPNIRVIERPPGIPANCAHLTSNGYLCYIGPNQAHLPRDNLVGGILGCIEIAEKLLSRLAAGDALKDTQDEFHASWLGDSLLIDIDSGDFGSILDSQMIRVMSESEKSGVFLLGREKEKLLQRYKYWSPRLVDLPFIVRVVEAQLPLGAREHDWPLEDLFMLLNWLSSDIKAINGVYSGIKDIYSAKCQNLILIIQAPNASCAAWLTFPALWSDTPSVKSPIKFLHTVLRKKSKSISMLRLQPIRIDPKSWLERNLQDDQRGLSGKKIIMVGCGAIGGYLADLLAKSGAGFLGGHLVLIDDDYLSSGNLGRHVLGFRDIYKSKAMTLAEELRNRYPSINVLGLCDNILDLKIMHGGDLIVNATGDQALSYHMSEQWLEGRISRILFTWITGTGCGAQAYFLEKKGQACLSCLDYSIPGGQYSIMSSEYQHNFKHAPSCGDWLVPYSASAAMHAAGLANDLALAWVRGEITSSPTFRSITLNHKTGKLVPPVSPSRRSDCFICSRYHL
ncbi:ThiF family adenylyltransferase [Pseudomonas alvandae]|uniref:ThiF family adenylyltransferase n=1 Tax=Pseudomonas TaxID=286 RepID=UPI003899BD34